LHTKNEPEFPLKGGAAFRSRLKDINRKIFRCGLETITENDKIFASSGFKESVAAMGMDKAVIPSNYSYLNSIISNLKQSNIWNNSDYWNINPSHPVSEMKMAVEKLTTDSFNEGSQISIVDIWNRLQETPFGLMNCSGAVFILGFLLKEYADGKYYKKDGANTVPLTFDGLADMIFCAVKGLPKATSLYIVKMTPEQERFCKVTGDIFNIPVDRRNSIQDVQQELRQYFARVTFPLWSLTAYAENENYFGFGEAFISIINLLCDFVAPEPRNGRDETKIAEEISRLYGQNPGIEQCLKNAVSPDNMKEGIKLYIASKKHELISLARRLNIGDARYISELKTKLSADSSWLWDKGDIDVKIEELYDDYKLIDEINKIINVSVNTLEDAATRIREKLGAVRMPYAFFKDECPEIEILFKNLITVYKTGSFKEVNKNNLLRELQQKTDTFNLFFNNSLFAAFKKKIEKILETKISDSECYHLYNRMDSNVIGLELEQYIQSLQQVYSEYQKNQKLNALIAKWRELSGTKSPKDWSLKHKVPVLCLFGDEINDARAAFEIINKSFASSENQIDIAISFLDQSKKIRQINNPVQCDAVFKQYISGDFEMLITDLDEVKDLLIKKLGNNVYDWYMRKHEIDGIVKEYCTDKYKTSYYSKVFQKIDSLSPEKAKEYLKELIKNEPLVGIRIMKD